MRRFEITEAGGGSVGLTGYGRTLEELFTHLALGMFGLRADVTTVQPMASVPIFAHADDLDMLLVAWLRELLFAAERDRLVFMNCRVHQVTLVPADHPAGTSEKPNLCMGEAVGEALDPDRHTLSRTLKAVTSREAAVRRDGDLWVAHVTLT